MKFWQAVKTAVVFVLGFLFGEYSVTIPIMVVCMLIDYILGVGVAYKGKSGKSETGAISSQAGFVGILRKLLLFVEIIIANFVDILTGQAILRDAMCVLIICNECISIIENLGLLGVPVPDKLKDAIEVLKK